jgi:hypothetical protein
MKRLFVLGLAALFVLALVPAASAQSSGYEVFANAGWLVPCAEGWGGVVTVTADIYAPTGSEEEGLYADYSPNWIPAYWEVTWVANGFFKVDSQTWGFFVPDEGFVYEAHDLYAEGGGYIASVEIYAECPSGLIEVYNNSIYGVHMPDPAERVQAKVLFDVNVHSEPNPDLAIPGAVLLAGQDWFVVDSVVGTDGNLWYEVFVGGAHNGFVPAAAMSLPAPLP